MIQVLELGGNHLEPALAHSLMRLTFFFIFHKRALIPTHSYLHRSLLQVLELGGNHLEPALAHSLMRLIAEQVGGVQCA